MVKLSALRRKLSSTAQACQWRQSMISVRWRKVLRDLWTNELRTMLAILAIAIGVFGVGSILTTYAILTREITTNFMDTHPPSAILTVDGADRALANAVQGLPGVSAAEPRRLVYARILIGPDQWRPLLLFVVHAFHTLRLAP